MCKETFIGRRYTYRFQVCEDDDIIYKCNVITELCDAVNTHLNCTRSCWSLYDIKANIGVLSFFGALLGGLYNVCCYQIPLYLMYYTKLIELVPRKMFHQIVL